MQFFYIFGYSPIKKTAPISGTIQTFGDITIVPVHEPGPAERYRKYKRILQGKISTCWILDDSRCPAVHSFWVHVAAFLVSKLVVFYDACN